MVSNSDYSTDGWTNADSSETWRMHIGKDFGWAWIAINQEDALDGLLLSFSGIKDHHSFGKIKSGNGDLVISRRVHMVKCGRLFARP